MDRLGRSRARSASGHSAARSTDRRRGGAGFRARARQAALEETFGDALGEPSIAGGSEVDVLLVEEGRERRPTGPQVGARVDRRDAGSRQPLREVPVDLLRLPGEVLLARNDDGNDVVAGAPAARGQRRELEDDLVALPPPERGRVAGRKLS